MNYEYAVLRTLNYPCLPLPFDVQFISVYSDKSELTDQSQFILSGHDGELI
eukprot:UN22185